MNDKRIENYLKQATRGLWGRKGKEIKEELSTHIEGRVNTHLVAGLSMNDAIDKTLRELGQPKVVSAGMYRLYTLPLVAGSSLVLSSIFALSIFLLTQSTAQLLETLPVFPSEQCLSSVSIKNCEAMEIWLNLDELVIMLESQGVDVIQNKHAIGLTFPDSKTTVYLNRNSGITSTIEISYNQTRDMAALTGYITLQQFVLAFKANSLAPILHISHWNPITLKIGQVSFEVKHNDEMAERFYLDYLQEVRNDLYNLSRVKRVESMFYPRESSLITKRVLMPEATVGMYGIIQLDSISQDDHRFTLFVNPSYNPGQLVFHGPLGPVRFLGSTDPLEKSPRTAVLLRLTGEVKGGKLGYEIIPPEQFSLE